MDLIKQNINNYLTYLATNKKVSASTQNQALAALLFYFRFIKNEPPMELENVVHAKKSTRLPVVFSRTEVKMIIAHMEGSKQLAAELMYGTGMRLNELLSLRILDIDFAQNQIVIRHGKGNKDRYVMLPQKLIPKLKAHIQKVQELLGHSDIKTTMIYTHVLNKGPSGVISPFDLM